MNKSGRTRRSAPTMGEVAGGQAGLFRRKDGDAGEHAGIAPTKRLGVAGEQVGLFQWQDLEGEVGGHAGTAPTKRLGVAVGGQVGLFARTTIQNKG